MVSFGIEVHVVRLARIGRNSFNLLGLGRLFVDMYSSIAEIDRVTKGRKINCVHSNTLAVVSGAIWSFMRGIPHVWHVHEIIIKPRLVQKGFAILLYIFSDKIVYNSNATRDAWVSALTSLASKSVVVWNGIERTTELAAPAVQAFRDQVGVTRDEVLVALVGRINRWKGQETFVDVATLLWAQGIRNIRYLILGGAPPGQGYYLDRLLAKINESPAAAMFVVLEFRNDVWSVWDAVDIAVVPSVEPEPFGMVALEAMTAKKPVIAAAHGGLTDIVKHDETGLLIAPCDVSAFAESIKALVNDAHRRSTLGERGFVRAQNQFSLVRFVESFQSIYLALSS
jgi:glycosyltransferase involved in cell wall biosynthesis